MWHDFADLFANTGIGHYTQGDRPLRGAIAAPFPTVHTVPFHYKNPMSGRVPPLLLP